MPRLALGDRSFGPQVFDPLPPWINRSTWQTNQLIVATRKTNCQ